MVLNKKRLLIILFVISFVISVVLGLGRMNAFSETADNVAHMLNGPALRHARGAYFHSGTIEKTGDSSITLYHGATYIIAASTICKAGSAGENMMHIHKVSCSYFTQGMTVSVTSKKNTIGKLVATEIREVFY